MKDTRNLIFHRLLSCADNFNPVRHEHLIFLNLAHVVTERVSVKKNSTIRPSTQDRAVTDHPGQRYGFKFSNLAMTELRPDKESIGRYGVYYIKLCAPSTD